MKWLSNLFKKKPKTPDLAWAHDTTQIALTLLEDVSFFLSCNPVGPEAAQQAENAISRTSALQSALLIEIRTRNEASATKRLQERLNEQK